MNIESRSPGDHIARKPKLWGTLFVVLSVSLTLLLWNADQENLWLGVLSGAGVTLYLFVAAKMNEWASSGDDHITARPELWFGVWFVVSTIVTLLELPTASGSLAGTALYGLFVGANVTVGLFLVALANRAFFSR
ncbi:hypothetical protein [Haladaptatus sp. NG-WS-4]